MDKRRFKRISVGYNTEIILHGISYAGVIEDLSHLGVNVIIAPSKTPFDLTPDETLEIKFQPVIKEILNFHGRVKWLYKTPRHYLTTRIGMEIINPPWDSSYHFV